MNLRERIMLFMHQEAYKPLAPEDLATELGLKSRELAEYWAVLAELEAEALIIKTRFGKYGVPERMNLFVGTLSASEKGFGFVMTENPAEADVYIPVEAMLNAMHGDKVVARLGSREPTVGRAREGEIIRIVQRANRRIVGTFESSRRFGFIVPDDSRIKQDIFVAKADNGGARNGDKVVAEITKWPEKRRNAEGRIVEVLGRKGDVGIEILSIIKNHNLATVFPPEVEQAAAAVHTAIAADELAGRRDLRELTIVTIDGEDAKDLDDAVHVERLKNGRYLLGVHIADVSHYVRENSPLDNEASERGTSVYLADRVLPMLPPRLSNGICSLNPGEDRLTMSINMEIDYQGNVQSYEIFPGVIRVHTRLSYNIVRRILADNDEEMRNTHRPLLPQLEEMERLCRILRERRMRRGAIDFDFDEVKVVLDDSGRPLDIIKKTRSIAESIVEEFMLVANETVAEHMHRRSVPFVFRVHEEPEEEKMIKLNTLLQNFGQGLGKTDEVSPKALQKVLGRIAGRPEERIISTVMLRSLKQARYGAENLGHFGLAAPYYTHFTSPIRRYPDLIVHRILRETFRQGDISAKRREKLAELLPEIALHSSQRERAAAEAERQTVDLKKAEYMAGFIGEEFSGAISGVTGFGLFVELENGVEGLVHVSSLDDDYYNYSEERYSLIGARSGKVYRLGDAIKVVLLKVNTDERTMDFVPVGIVPAGGRAGVPNKPRQAKNKRPAAKAQASLPAKTGGKQPLSRGRDGKKRHPGNKQMDSQRQGKPGRGTNRIK